MRSPLLPVALALAGALAGLPALVVPADAATAPRRIAVTRWDARDDLATGVVHGLVIGKGRLRFGRPAGTEGGNEYGTWTSPWVEPGFALTELVPSWQATTPGASSVRFELRARGGGRTSSWDTIARWAHDDSTFRRTSSTGQPDDLGRVSYDTWLSASTAGVSGWQLRVTLLRRTGGTARPTVDAVGAMASRLPAVTSVATSAVGSDRRALGTVLRVPRYSQMAHDGEYPQYDGGGEAWCSPTSLTMVLDYYDALPSARSYAWVSPAYPDRVVPHVARMVYDERLGGTGNWAFNTAYAASRTGTGEAGAFVTRLRNLREAQRFIAAGIPLVASVTFASGQLDGAPISSTNGHLLVIVGFRDNGDVVVNDPAASTRSGVRRSYDRGQFEDAWLKRYPSGSSMRGSGGLVYVVTDEAHPLPAGNAGHNW